MADLIDTTKVTLTATTAPETIKVDEEIKNKNWAEIADEEEDDDQEIGAATDNKKLPAPEEKKVVKKDYGPPE